MSKREIVRKERTSWNFIMSWTKSSTQDFTKDNRGWPKDKRRKWLKEDEEKVRAIHHQLKKDPYQFYIGATAIEQEWRKKYPRTPPLPLRTIGRIMVDLKLSGKRRKDKRKGAARYLCYPEHTIYTLLGGRVLESDFIGKKYITGRTKPLNFITFSFKKEPKLRYFKGIEGQTADNFIEQSEHFFQEFEKPDFMKIDNSLTTIGSASGKRNVSRVMKFLLEKQVVPIFTVPRKPFSQASIEGNNSVFARKFWNRIDFKSVEEVNEKLEWFNLSSQKYLHYQPPKTKPKQKKNSTPNIYIYYQVSKKG